jgi:hypothetical protein
MTAEWLRRPQRVFLLEAYFPPFHPRLEYDPATAVARVADMACNVLRFGAAGHWALFPSRFVPPHPELAGRDLVGVTRRLAWQRDIRFVVYVPACHSLPLAITDGLRPEWTRRATPEGEPAPAFGQFGRLVRPICWASPYREAFAGLLREVVERFEPDALYFDTWRPQYFAAPAPGCDHPVCYCAGCRRQFGDLPYRPDGRYTDAERSRLRAYAAWYGELTLDVFRGARALADAHGLPMLFNRYLRETPWDPRVLRGHEGVLFESHAELVARVEGIGLGTSRGQTVWQYVGNYDPWPRLVPPHGEAMAREAVASAAFGAQPAVAAGNRLLYGEAPALRDALRSLAELAARLGPFRPLRWAGVVAGSERRATSGIVRAFLDLHLPVETIDPQALPEADLGGYAVLVLPDVAELPDPAREVLRGFPGGLLAIGRPPDPALFGAALVQADFVPADNVSWGRPWDVYLADPGGERLPVVRFHLVREQPGSRVTGHIVAVQAEGEAAYPGVVRRGRTTLVAADLGAAYEATRHPGLATRIDALAREVASVPPPVEVRGPAGLAVSVLEGPRGRAVVAIDHEVARAGRAGGQLVVAGRAYPIPAVYAIHQLDEPGAPGTR